MMEEDKTEKLLEKLMRVVDELVEDAYVVTDGINVSAILTNIQAGKYLAERMRRETKDEAWECCGIPAAIQIAYERGRLDTLNYLHIMQSNENKKEQANEEDQKLRDSELQQEGQED